MKKQEITFPLTNDGFLKVVSNSFDSFIRSGTSRSNVKLKPLHGAIAKDLAEKLGNGFNVMSQRFEKEKEGTMTGRYYDKKVDITIFKDNKPVCGIGVKFVMQNYSQNSNKYFENMLGETANIRCNRHPYFQIFIILDKLPYYRKDKSITRWETFTEHNIEKYVTLSEDNPDVFFHTPNKTLIYVVHVPDAAGITNCNDYMEYYKGLDFQSELSDFQYEEFGNTVILNDYERFREKVFYTIMAL